MQEAEVREGNAGGQWVMGKGVVQENTRGQSLLKGLKLQFRPTDPLPPTSQTDSIKHDYILKMSDCDGPHGR